MHEEEHEDEQEETQEEDDDKIKSFSNIGIAPVVTDATWKLLNVHSWMNSQHAS